jgi:PAS fold
MLRLSSLLARISATSPFACSLAMECKRVPIGDGLLASSTSTSPSRSEQRIQLMPCFARSRMVYKLQETMAHRMNQEFPVDLDSCAREPIHIPGAIQPHGLLFVLREPELIIVQVSENVNSFLGVPADNLLEKGLSSFLNPEQVEKVQFALSSVDPRDSNPVDLERVSDFVPG